MKYRFFPLITFLILTIPMFYFLFFKEDTKYQIPSPESLPSSIYQLQSIIDNNKFSLPSNNEPYILHVFSSWCNYCLKEHDLIKKISSTIPVYGLVWRDTKISTLKYLNKSGNPYQDIALLDPQTIVGLTINMMPTTLYIGKNGSILYYNRGSIKKDFLLNVIHQQSKPE